MLMRFVVAQKFFGAANDGAGQACELGGIDAIAFLRRSGTDFVKKDKIASFLVNLHVKIPETRQEFREFSQLVIVRRKERFGTNARVIVYIFEHGAGNSQAIVGRSSAPKFVQEN